MINRLVGLVALMGLAPACAKRGVGENPQPQKAAAKEKPAPLASDLNKLDRYVQVPAECKVRYAGVPIRFAADVADYRQALVCK